MGSLLGAFHLTEIPEIFLENQMEHVNFWNDVSLILKRFTLRLKSLLSNLIKKLLESSNVGWEMF
jgi:hypothetical protein